MKELNRNAVVAWMMRMSSTLYRFDMVCLSLLAAAGGGCRIFIVHCRLSLSCYHHSK